MSTELKHEESGNHVRSTSRRVKALRTCIITILIIGIGTGGYFGYQQYLEGRKEEALSLIKGGDQAYSEGNYESAIDLYAKSLSSQEQDGTANKIKNAKQMHEWSVALTNKELKQLIATFDQITVSDKSIFIDADAMKTKYGTEIQNSFASQAEDAISRGDLEQAKLLIKDAEKYGSQQSSGLNSVRDKVATKLASDAKAFLEANDVNKAEVLIKEAVLYATSDAGLVKEIRERVSEEKNKPPLKVAHYLLQDNIIGTPELSVVVQNIGEKVIDAFKVEVKCFDGFDKPTGIHDGVFRGIAQNKVILPGSFSGSDEHWSLVMYDNTKRVEITITEIHFTDGTTWSKEKAASTEL